MANSNFPSYEQLFGELDTRAADPGRTVYSPAAYLADLLQLLEVHFGFNNATPEDFFVRRSDVELIDLNGENAFETLPYLDIVNRVLENKIMHEEDAGAEEKQPPYGRLLDTKYPFHLPFSLDDARYRTFLSFTKARSHEIYEAYQVGQAEAAIVAREYLGLSAVTYQSLISPPSEHLSFFQEYYGFATDQTTGDIFDALRPVDAYLKRTNINGESLRHLLFQHLSRTSEPSELSEANQNFINHGTTDYAFVPLEEAEISADTPEDTIYWGDLPGDISQVDTSDWFKRLKAAALLIRLSSATGISILDLNTILTQCCGHVLDARALNIIATLKYISDTYEMPIDKVCVLGGLISHTGLGHGQEPMDLFNRVFNVPFVSFDKTYLQAGSHLHEEYAEYSLLASSASAPDILHTDNKDLRKRIQKALSISDSDFYFLVNKLRVTFPEDSSTHPLGENHPTTLTGLSLIYRINLLARLMGVSFEAFFEIMDFLDHDPALRSFNPFSLLLHFTQHQSETYQIVQGGQAESPFLSPDQVDESLWLTQILLAMGKWMEAHDLSGGDLAYMLTGERSSKAKQKLFRSNEWNTRQLLEELEDLEEKEEQAAEKATIAFLNQMHQTFVPTLFGPAQLATPMLSPRASRSLFHSLEEGGGITLVSDSRLLHLQSDSLTEKVRMAVKNLGKFREDDFVGLGLAEKLADKLLRNLVIKGYIEPGGRLIESAFPDKAEDFKINRTDQEESLQLFGLLHQIYQEEAKRDRNQEEVEMMVFLSDLSPLTEDEQRKTELYDNLIFNGYIDENGNVLDTDRFADESQAPAFEASSRLQQHAPQLHALIVAQKEKFQRASLSLDLEIFAAIGLKPVELEELAANLIFNGYLKQDREYVDKTALLKLNLEEFLLEPRLHYYHGAQILAAIQQQISAFKDTFFTLTTDLLTPLADTLNSAIIFDALEEGILKERKWPEDLREALNDPNNAVMLRLPSYLGDTEKAVIWRSILEFQQEAEQFLLTPLRLSELGLDQGEQIRLQEALVQDEKLGDYNCIPQAAIPYFLDSNHVLSFRVAGFEDFSRDIFFELQTIALALSETMAELERTLRQLAQRQEEVVIDGLQGYLEISGENVKTILSYLFGPKTSMLGYMAGPVLETVNEDGLITSLPPYHLFSIQLRRLRQMAAMVTKFNLTHEDVSVLLQDQELMEKLPENLILPDGVTHFQTILETEGDDIYLFVDKTFFTYSKATYELSKTVDQPQSIQEFHFNLASHEHIDAAFIDPHGHTWLVADSVFYRKEKDKDHFEVRDRLWGRTDNNFLDAEQIDASFIDYEGKTYLFAGDQYVRYSSPSFTDADGNPITVDEGYPKHIAENWQHELRFDLPADFAKGVDAAFASPNGRTYLFKKGAFVDSESGEEIFPIEDKWGKIENNFQNDQAVSAAMQMDGEVLLYAGDQQITYWDQLENEGVLGKEGTLKKIETYFQEKWHDVNVPDAFLQQIDAASHGLDGRSFLFSGDKSFSFFGPNPIPDLVSHDYTPDRWGWVNNYLQRGFPVTAAFAGLDGRSYLFAGEQYVRYSRGDHSVIDESYPRMIYEDWGGLQRVDAAFILGGKTYLFGIDLNQADAYVCYSTNDYSEPDKGYPKVLEAEESFWNFTDADELNPSDKRLFARPDAVFVSKEDRVFLFKEGLYITADHNLRWWTKPQPISEYWDSLPFSGIAAAFTARNGTTYVFEGGEEDMSSWEALGLENNRAGGLPSNMGQSFVSYTDAQFTKIDHRTPARVHSVWGRMVNNIARTGRVDAAMQLTSRPTEEDDYGKIITLPEEEHLFLFSGNQFYRYTWTITQVHQDEETKEWFRIDPASQGLTPLEPELESLITDYEGSTVLPELSAYVDEGYPKRIKGGLKEEARFKQLPAAFAGPLEASFADDQNVFLFHAEGMLVVSEPELPQYLPEEYLGQAVRAGYLERGSLMLLLDEETDHIEGQEGAHSWYHYNAVEQAQTLRRAHLPETIRRSDSDFYHEANAVLIGTDGHRYVFQGDQYFHVHMESRFPIAKDWGRVRNEIESRNQIDAAFVGLDGHTYMFSGDQFVIYEKDLDLPHSLPPFVKDAPRSIEEHWCGLKNVRLAFVIEEKTYLVEQWDEAGNFRFLCLEGDDYSKKPPLPTATDGGYEMKKKAAYGNSEDYGKSMGYDTYGETADDNPYLQHANFRDWEVLDIPEEYYDDAHNPFQEVHALLEIDEHRVLFNKDHFIHYHLEERVWSYPRPIEQLVVTLPLLISDVQGFTPDLQYLRTAFQGPEKSFYFFGPEAFTYFGEDTDGFAPLAEIKERWGLLENNLLTGGSVDAAFVLDEQTTYLFSGDQFFRYSTPDYRYVDEGYPKEIISHLREEAGFAQLPPVFEDTLGQELANGGSLGAIVSNPRNIYLFIGDRCYIANREGHKTYPKDRIGALKNRIAEEQKIDAAYVNGQGQTVLLSGDQAFRYTHAYYDYDELSFVDEGYPKSIEEQLTMDTGHSIHHEFVFDLDATLYTHEGSMYLFRWDDYLQVGTGTVGNIHHDWAQSTAFFPGEDQQAQVEAMFVGPDGKTYLFQGDQYLRYSEFDNELADEGYPKPIKDNWGDLAPTFEDGIDHAFVFEGKTYFLKGDSYVRFGDPEYKRMDAIFPQLLNDRWRYWNDFLLGDLKTISQYAALKADYDGDGKFTQFFFGGQGENRKPYQLLAELFDWEEEEVAWLKRRNTFLDQPNQFEELVRVEELIHMVSIFKLAHRVGTQPEDLYTNVWKPLFHRPADAPPTEAEIQDFLEQAADAVYRYLGEQNSPKDWEILENQLHNALNLIKRDTLLPYLLHLLPDVENERDLFNLLLIDVERGSEAETSLIKEAISAVQIYMHRYQINLESPDETALSPERKDELKQWWKWMKNYRVWEANRKVFLYPENYIRPELRDTKTPEFKGLEQSLLQGELTAETAMGAFYEYLDGFSRVGNLRISGANVYEEDGKDALVIFGHTRTEPLEYYYRKAHFEGDLVEWHPWQKVEMTINARRVFPVHAFGRLMLFWIEIEAFEESEGKLEATNNDKGTEAKVKTSKKKLSHRAHIKFSYYNYTQRWSAPQLLKEGIPLNYEIDAAYVESVTVEGETSEETVIFSGRFCMKTSKSDPAGTVKTIGQYEEFANLPDNFQTRVDAATIFKGHRYLFHGGSCFKQNLADNSGENLTIKELFHVPPAGATFLAYVKGPFGIAHHISVALNGLDPILNPVIVGGQEVNLSSPYPSEGFDAAFPLTDDVLCLIDKNGNYFFYTEEDEGGVKKLSPIPTLAAVQGRIGPFELMMTTLANKGGSFAPADAVFKKHDDELDEKILFVLRDGEYECYTTKSDGMELIPLSGFPKSIRGNLSFNMDKFFDKLHAAWDGDTDGIVRLFYSDPKSKTLLNGRLFADLSFEELNPDEDPITVSLSTWPDFTSNHMLPYGPVSSDLEVEAGATTMEETAEELHRRLEHLINLQTAADRLEDATEELETVIAEDSTPSTIATAEANFANDKSAIEGIVGSLTGDSNQVIKDFATDLHQAIATLSTALNAYNGDGDEDLEGDRTALGDTASAEKSDNDTRKTGIDNEISSIGTEADSLRDDLSDETAEANQEAHSPFAVSFRGFIDGVLAEVRLWGGDDPEKYVDDLTTLPAAESALTNYEASIAPVTTAIENGKADLSSAVDNIQNDSLSAALTALNNARVHFNQAVQDFGNRSDKLAVLNNAKVDLLDEGSKIYNLIRETYQGQDDLFDADFEIINKTNFTFSEPNWYVFEAKRGTFLCRPRGANSTGIYELIRLTTTMDAHFSTQLFLGGMEGLLSLTTQQNKPETPVLGDAGVSFNPARFHPVPAQTGLDFHGANLIYYWEIFYHAPYLIAQSLNTAQQFEAAKEWYEYIYNPGQDNSPWLFSPFEQANTQAGDESYLLDPNQMDRYLNDPFDPHTLASLRPVAYQKAIVMNYIDNLLDWGDSLFTQYTVESINEAMMLYILAYDLLGDEPDGLGIRVLTDDENYQGYRALLEDANAEDRLNELEFLFELENDLAAGDLDDTEEAVIVETPNDNILNLYFYIPENDLFLGYWNRVQDRLYKIRHSLNILGKKQALPLFQPPIDPMALVRAVAGGASIAQAVGGLDVAVPPYRFNFMLSKARELVQKLSQYGGELLAALEKKDAESLSLLQTRQEGELHAITKQVRQAQLEEAEINIVSLNASLENAQKRIEHYEQVMENGMLITEGLQILLMGLGSISNLTSAGLKVISAIVSTSTPDALVGPFIMGVKYGGSNVGQGLDTAADVFQTLGEGLSMAGETLGIVAQYQRMYEDWELQKKMAVADEKMIKAQILGAELQYKAAEYELELVNKQIEHNKAMATFMRDKFTNEELYQWMSSSLSGLYYQTYKLAYDMAKYAEKAYQFQRGAPRELVNFIRPTYWNSQRKGLMAGEQLGLDLDRMEMHYMESDDRRLEVTKNISLLELDPLAFLTFKATGVCEFSLSEAMFDYDFPGHYLRLIKTMSITFDAGEGKYLNAMLTQLSSKTVMEADAKAVKYLLDPRDQQPLSIRSDWKVSQQIALSHHDEYEKNNGMFELRFDTDHYLPFEGTGAVSTWRLELKGKHGHTLVKDLVDLVINVKFTAVSGGKVFADEVRGMLKPYPTVHYLDLNYDFHDEWLDFLDSDSDELSLDLSRALFPNMASGKILSIYPTFDQMEEGKLSMILNGDEEMELEHQKLLEPSSLSISSRGSTWTLKVKGDKELLRTVQLVIGYKAKVQ